MGTGVTSVIADCAHEVGAVAITLVTVTFEFEGTRRRKKANEAVYKLKNHADSTIVFPLDNLFSVVNKRTSITKAFYYANYSIMLAARNIVDELKSIKFVQEKDNLKNTLPQEGIVELESNNYDQYLLIESEKNINVKIISANHSEYLETLNNTPSILGDISYIPKESDTKAQCTQSFTAIPGWMRKEPLPKNQSNKINDKNDATELMKRSDGKQVCVELRSMRSELAQANNIPFESEECSYEGLCAGTCEKCDQEAAYLRDKLSEIPEAERKYPQHSIQEWENIL